MRNPPSVEIYPPSKTIEFDGGTATFTVTVTNNDTAEEGATTFTLSVSSDNTNDFEAPSLETTSLELVPGASGSVELTIADKPGAANTGIATLTVTVSSPNHDPVTATATVTLGDGAATGWNKLQPALTVDRDTATIQHDGGAVQYVVTIKNLDSGASASATEFHVEAGNSNEADYEPPVVEPSTLRLEPGSQGAVVVTIKDKLGNDVAYAETSTMVTVSAPDHPTASITFTTRTQLERMVTLMQPRSVWVVRQTGSQRILGIFTTPERASEWVAERGLTGSVEVERFDTDYPYYEAQMEVLLVRDIDPLHRLILLEVERSLEKEFREGTFWADYILSSYGCDRIAPLEEGEESTTFGLPSQIVIPLPDFTTGQFPTVARETKENTTPSIQIGLASHPDLDRLYVTLVGKKRS